MQQTWEKEYKIKQDWVEKEIHWELCKELKFNHTRNGRMCPRKFSRIYDVHQNTRSRPVDQKES